MKRLNRASITALLVVLTVAFLSSALLGQINGAPPSVTSLGFGGHNGSIHGIAPSVTSMGPQGYTSSRTQFPKNNGLFGVNSNHNINDDNGHHHRYGHYYPGYYGYYGGYYDVGSDQPAPSDDQYNGGPTIFDPRGSGAASYVPIGPTPSSDLGQPIQAQTDSASGPGTSEQAETVLIFKDGHQAEVSNYAIVGNMLYDLSDGHRRKIALDDLDLTATSKENETRGTDFELPGHAQAN